jgi:hypothetical protein
MRKTDRYYDLLHEQIFRETGVPNPTRRGELAALYPDGLPRQRIARWIKQHLRRDGAARP